jgi:anaerobic selenocysteine-containing dehydrogenase
LPGVMKRSVCPYDCPDTCALMVEVVDGRAVRVFGDPEHPFTRGTLCPKMNHYERTVHSPLRLTQPLQRTGPKGSGQFRPISRAEAVQQIIDRWKRIIGQYGAEAILPYSYAGTMGLIQRNAGHPFFHGLGASRLDRTICAPAKEAGWRAVMGSTVAPHPDDVADSDLIILWGINAVATNIHFLHGVREAKKRGATVWLVDTYDTASAAMADQTFLVKPGSNGALALGWMHLLAREGRIE